MSDKIKQMFITEIAAERLRRTRRTSEAQVTKTPARNGKKNIQRVSRLQEVLQEMFYQLEDLKADL